MPTNHLLILSTFPDKDTAQHCAQLLVSQKLAACVNILPGLTSIYSWQGQIESADEHLLLIKSKKASYAAIENTIKTHHPYELPEIIALPIESGLPKFLHWIDSCDSTD